MVIAALRTTTLEEELLNYDEREYQEIGTKFLSLVRRGFLTDDPGLGKTYQAIRAAELPAQVFAPQYLCGQWEQAILRAHPDAVIAYADGTRKQRDKILNKSADWYIANYEMAKSYGFPTNIRTYINDESHHLRNRKADKTKAVNALENSDPTARIYNLTATPFWKNVDDIWMQAHVLYPNIFKNYNDFVKLYCQSVNLSYGTKVLGIKKAMRQGLKDLLAPIMLGRTYQQVGRFLPDVVETEVRLKLPPALKGLYENLVNNYSLKYAEEDELKKLIFQPTSVLHALRQVTFGAGKIDALKGILEDNKIGNEAGSRGMPAVIGCWYIDHAKKVVEALGEKNAVLITGELDGPERQRRAMWAQANGKHIVASQKSLSEGVNLYKYKMFIQLEKHYVPGSNHQFLSRVQRDRNDNGRDREPIRLFNVMVSGTLDVTINRISKSRRTSIEATRELLELTLKREKNEREND